MKLIQKVDKLFEQVSLTDSFLQQQLEQLSKSTKEIESVIFLKDNNVLQNKRFDVGFGDYKSVQYDVSKIADKALALGANYIISVHNHPNGTQHPSEKDIESFRNMKNYFSKHGVKLRAFVVAGNPKGGMVKFTEYDETTNPEMHTEEYIDKGKELVAKAVQQGKKIQVSDKEIEQKLSGVKNISDFENKINTILNPYNLRFVPVGSEKGV